ncbi:dTDP-4-dehydrorhamnose reductase [Marilutibacter spongiae]|uniref:dTDP-4-dehydrorhamnose reductase n=1 Tax=Marilutibacter spongiae TaxID=2025720 RepID=A0A7W3TLC4_9GAMM|nr:dTDP-4-dehydrorhamnose reductase [Lysobacter spongiae]MBB1060306.1 dTDP-4-dehydrorhamnose reductase [Lysobacter spongiae]
MKSLVIGANGQLGHALVRSLSTLGTVVAATRDGERVGGGRCEAVDLADGAAIGSLIERVRPDVVVNAAAHTAVDKAEQEPDVAFRINAQAPAAMARACARQGIALVHYSTDYVFNGGAHRPYTEADPTDPLGVYGESKRAGERALAESGARYLVLRTAWVYGLHGHNFLRTMLRLGAERDELRVVDDQVGTPTPAWLIADTTAAILEKGIQADGIRHLTARGQCSWCDFAVAIMDEATASGILPRKPRVVPIRTSEYPTPARRPAYSVMDVGRLEQEYGLELPDWRDALSRTLAPQAAP